MSKPTVLTVDDDPGVGSGTGLGLDIRVWLPLRPPARDR